MRLPDDAANGTQTKILHTVFSVSLRECICTESKYLASANKRHINTGRGQRSDCWIDRISSPAFPCKKLAGFSDKTGLQHHLASGGVTVLICVIMLKRQRSN